MLNRRGMLEFQSWAQEMRAIADTLMCVVTPDMKLKQLLKAARKEHPEATKKDIARAAFFALITHSEEDYGKEKNLQAFAIAERLDGAI